MSSRNGFPRWGKTEARHIAILWPFEPSQATKANFGLRMGEKEPSDTRSFPLLFVTRPETYSQSSTPDQGHKWVGVALCHLLLFLPKHANVWWAHQVDWESINSDNSNWSLITLVWAGKSEIEKNGWVEFRYSRVQSIYVNKFLLNHNYMLPIFISSRVIGSSWGFRGRQALQPFSSEAYIWARDMWKALYKM